jgi:hypothetical protein
MLYSGLRHQTTPSQFYTIEIDKVFGISHAFRSEPGTSYARGYALVSLKKPAVLKERNPHEDPTPG